jgi:sulfoxide reductase heme-binding subunit YedZ
MTAAAVLCSLIYFAFPKADTRQRLSLVSAYAALAFVVASLALGPYRVWRRLANPVSFDLRRDVGIWVAILALIHTGLGLTVHLRGRMWMYFLDRIHPVHIQLSTFGLANYLGAAATFIFAVLLFVSNDFSLRQLGIRRWKSIQRWSYVAAASTAIHGFAYQFVEKRGLGWVAILSVLVSLGIFVQVGGYFAIRRILDTAATKEKV